jgi:CBS domain-containing membrane protein
MEKEFEQSVHAIEPLKEENSFKAHFKIYIRMFLGQEFVLCGGPVWRFSPKEWITGFVGSFCAIAVLGLYSQYGTSRIVQLGIMPSMGATAVLLYAAPDSAFAQPRHVLGGSMLSALIGMFCQYISVASSELRWLAGALAVSLSIVVMMITKTVHPPAGATALFISTSTSPLVLGAGYWVLLVLVLAGNLMMMAIAVVLDNVFLFYPRYWL